MSSNGKRVRARTHRKSCAPVERDGDAPYSYEQFGAMNERFVAAMERVIERGLERSPQQDERAA